MTLKVMHRAHVITEEGKAKGLKTTLRSVRRVNDSKEAAEEV
jgi:hypothetical protein